MSLLEKLKGKLNTNVMFFVTVQLLSLLLEALSCPDQGVQLSTLSCLEPILINPPSALIQQLEALVSRLLALSSSPAMVSEIYRHNIRVYGVGVCCKMFFKYTKRWQKICIDLHRRILEWNAGAYQTTETNVVLNDCQSITDKHTSRPAFNMS